MELQGADWYRALTLAERVTAMPSARSDESPQTIDTDLADWRLERWRSQSPFNKGTTLAERLDLDRLSEEEFRRLLGEPAEDLRARAGGPPSWMTDIAQAFAQPGTAPRPESSADDEWTGF
ncbi:MAG TPA: hypothetical protein VF713_04075, partial [Thermoanaerobaculia bacterium]